MTGVFHRLTGVLAGVAAAFVLASGAQAGPLQPEEAGTVRAEPKIQPALPPAPPVVPKSSFERAVKVRLGSPAKALEVQPADTLPIGVPVQIGFARTVEALGTAQQLAQALDWQPAGGDARVAAIALSSSGALALRAGVRIESLPDGAQLRFYAPGSSDGISIGAAQVNQTIARNVASGDDGEGAHTFWSPVVEGETLVVEIEVPDAASANGLRVSVPLVSHLAGSPRDGFFKAAAAACELDAMCYQSSWGNESNAVSRIVFTDAGSSFACTGTLLADRDPGTFVPYFLTANHCVSTQTVASTVQSYWFWRSAACDSATRGASQTTFGGGTLLYASATTDTSFMRLNSAPPANAAYAGWIATPPSQGAPVTGLHHPEGDLQKISFGNVASFWSCSAAKAGNFSCSGASAAAATFLGVAWRNGLTEAGSSGSPLFTDNGHYVVGQLFGGNGTCSTPGTDFYGRFDVAYNASLSQWLGLTSSGVTPAANYTDLWWNAAESGWGLSLTQHGNVLFAAWFVYDAAGKPTWYVMPGGTWTTSTTFSGDIYAATGPDPLASAFDPTRVVRTKVGSGTLRFTGTAQGSFAYTVNGVSETRPITREPFGGTVVTDGYGDLWWNASESGWGLSLHQQGNTFFGVWYTYAPDGTATWYVMPTGAWTDSATFGGNLYRASSTSAFFGRTFNPADVTRTGVGRMVIHFNGANSATMSYLVDGVSGIKQISRQPF